MGRAGGLVCVWGGGEVETKTTEQKHAITALLNTWCEYPNISVI